MIKVQISAEVFNELFEQDRIIRPAKVLMGIPKDVNLVGVEFSHHGVEFLYDDGNSQEVERKTITWKLEQTPQITTDNYEETFEQLWKDIILNSDGSINLDQVKRELHDFSFMIGEVS